MNAGRCIVGLSSLYLLAYSLFLVNPGIFWDDWCWLMSAPEEALEASWQLGFPLVGWLETALFRMGSWGLAFRVVTFFSFLLAGISLFGILLRFPMESAARFFICLMFLIAPLNQARITTCTVQYSICHASFFAGFWFLTAYLDLKRWPLRVAALLLLGFSFQTNSFLIYYLLPFAYLLVRRYPEHGAKVFLRFADFALAPVAYYAIKLKFFAPYGSYAGYNQLTFKPVTLAKDLILSGWHSFFRIFYESFAQLRSPGLIGLVVGGALITWMVARTCQCLPDEKPPADSMKRALLGIGLILLGVFPYLAVGKMPMPVEWESRHQLLVPLGLAVSTYYLSCLLFRDARGGFLCLLCGLFLASNFQVWTSFLVDWAKQVETIEAFRRCPALAQAHTILVDDQTRSLNAVTRRFRFYEWNAFLKVTFNQESRLGVNQGEYAGVEAYKQFESKHYLLSDYVSSEPDCKISLTVVHPDGFVASKVIERVVFDRLTLRDPLKGTGLIKANVI